MLNLGMIIMKNFDDDGDDHDVKPWNASQSVAPRPLKPRSPAQPPPRTASNDHHFDHHSDHQFHNCDDDKQCADDQSNIIIILVIATTWIKTSV